MVELVQHRGEMLRWNVISELMRGLSTQHDVEQNTMSVKAMHCHLSCKAADNVCEGSEVTAWTDVQR